MFIPGVLMTLGHGQLERVWSSSAWSTSRSRSARLQFVGSSQCRRESWSPKPRSHDRCSMCEPSVRTGERAQDQGDSAAIHVHRCFSGPSSRPMELSFSCRSRCLSAHCSTRVELRFLCSTCDRQRPSRRSSTLQYTCCAKASRGAPTIEWVSVLGRDAGTRGAALSSVMGYARSAEPLSVVLSCFS